jgi:tetratricopeptide (TPR) repeat protein
VLATLVLLLGSLLQTAPLSPVAGDEAFERMDYPAAIGAYDSLLEAHPKDPQLLWRLARASVCYGESFEDHRRKELCLKAEQYARGCIAADSTSAEGHTWLAGALGYIALDEGMERQAAMSFEILEETGRAIRLNPRDDAALSIRGSLYRALGNVSWVKRQMAQLLLGGIPGGGFEEGEAALKQAIAIAPGVMRHHYELGVLYLDWDRTEEARACLARAAELPVRTAIDIPRLRKIRELLAGLAR